jgi:hypothetical protein
MPYLTYTGLYTLSPSAERPPLAERATTKSDVSLPPIQTVLSPSPPPYTSLPSPPHTPSPSLPHTPSLEPPRTPRRERALETTRTDRIRIKTALEFNHSPRSIQAKFGYTLRQIQLARHARLTPRKHKAGRKPAIRSSQRAFLEEWLQDSPSHQQRPWRYIPFTAPEEELNHGAWATKTALEYGRGVENPSSLNRSDPTSARNFPTNSTKKLFRI